MESIPLTTAEKIPENRSLSLIPRKMDPFRPRGLEDFSESFSFSLPLAHITAVREITLGLGVFFWVLLMLLNRRILWPRTPSGLAFIFLAGLCFYFPPLGGQSGLQL